MNIQFQFVTGVYFPRLNHGGITYDDCNKVYDPEGGDELVLSNKPYHVYNWVPGHQYNMKMASTCKIFSLRAVIGPVSFQTIFPIRGSNSML